MKHILIVDDDIHINEMLDEVLCGKRCQKVHRTGTFHSKDPYRKDGRGHIRRV